mgnify:CR=1 FL=1
MTKIHKLDVAKTHMPSADKAFLDWFDLTMALPHDYMEEIFRLHARNMGKMVKKNGTDVSTSERIASFKSAANTIAARVAKVRVSLAIHNIGDDDDDD